ncbi:RHS repeat-associated core domain-containing protein [Flavobacterium sp. N1736]|uniref:RHS repeat-associated core domain-containing protein n=1 Tax=Flavobacterium sp. N1736 TaxID=2986823 RepID=UPI002224298C|nr:RHS repeat-associated core domain-containing protein [Flavobacterium sp. N1736]
MKKLLYILSALLLPLLVLAQTTSRNFIKSTSFQVETVTGNVSNDQKVEEITYFDGLGRPLQRIAKQSGGNKQDIITPFGYDYFGRQKRDYLSYARPASSLNFETSLVPDYYGDILELSYFYAAKYPDDFQNIDPSEATPFSEKYFEASALSRIKEQSAPGVTWKLDKFNDNDHTIKFEYNANGSNDIVKRFAVSFINGNKEVPNLEVQGSYTDLQLYKTITKNENWTSGKNNTTEEFKDKEGRVILKRAFSDYKDSNGQITSTETPHDTYYVYDTYGNLTFVIPPKAVDLIASSSAQASLTSTAVVAYGSTLNLIASSSIVLMPGFHAQTGSTFSAVVDSNQTTLDNLCYQYKYDSRNRLVEKKLPGKGWEYIVYDKLNRPILTQDAILQTTNKWIFTKYDAFSRPIYTGEYVNSSQTSRTAVQTLANGSVVLFENRLTTPLDINTVSINYSNNAFPNTGTDLLTITYYDNYANINLDGGTAITSYGITPITNAKGMTVCSKVRVLATNNWITTVSYYDTKGRIIYTYNKNNFLATENTAKSNLDFTGKILETTSTHKKTNAPDITIVDTYTYDHIGRTLNQKQKINNQPQEIIVSNTYDNLGQLITKSVGGVQTVNYNYNARGWLKDINDVNNIGSSLFAFKINYNTPSAGTPFFNGNISQTLWKTAHTDTSLRSYLYSYDALNRLIDAKDNLDRYNERQSYDKNGNIMTMFRNGNTILNTPNYGTIDNLTYAYDNGNKLLKVEDSSGNTQGFNNGNSGSNIDYGYDVNGNMTADGNKEIVAVAYNYLNLPTNISFSSGSIDYKYDAQGLKQQKIAGSITTQYAGGFQYENNVLQFFPHPEGYVRYNSGVYEYIYQYKDHLGNVRLSYNKNLNIIEENNYYPFGLKQSSHINIVTNQGNATAQKYKYNGKELQDELGLNVYDYGFRLYDPAIGRMQNPDPLAELAYDLTPNRYCFNNPMRFIDPSGLWETTAGGYTTNKAEDIKRFMSYLGFENNALNNSPTFAQQSTFIEGEMSEGGQGKLSDGSTLADEFAVTTYKQEGGGIKGYADEKSFGNFWHGIQKNLTPNGLDTRTIGQNLLGLTYPGGNNPKTYSGADDFSYVPSSLAEYPAIGHDRRYANIGTAGAGGLFGDTKAIGADWRFVGQELSILTLPVDLKTKVQAGLLGVGLGLFSTGKTVIQLSSPYNGGLGTVLLWDSVANKGVNNQPSSK